MHRRLGPGLVLAAVASAALLLAFGVDLGDSTVPVVLLLFTVAFAGVAIRSRNALARELDERVAEIEGERQVYADLSVRYERARIASELHDIVAHAMSVMVVQASAGQRLAARDPAATSEAFSAIAGAARQAGDDMRRLVTLLSDDAAGTSPELGVVEELVRRAAGTGLAVTLRLEGTREGLSVAAVELAYAVVRESLTNALRYAAGATVVVRIEGGAEELVIDVVNGSAPRATALAGHGTGSGLAGLRERAAQASGRLEAGPTQDGGWQVVARVPRRAPALPA